MAVEVALDALAVLAVGGAGRDGDGARTCSSLIVAVRCTLTWFASVWSISDVDDDSSLQCASCACTSRSERLASSCERRERWRAGASGWRTGARGASVAPEQA